MPVPVTIVKRLPGDRLFPVESTGGPTLRRTANLFGSAGLVLAEVVKSPYLSPGRRVLVTLGANFPGEIWDCGCSISTYAPAQFDTEAGPEESYEVIFAA